MLIGVFFFFFFNYFVKFFFLSYTFSPRCFIPFIILSKLSLSLHRCGGFLFYLYLYTTPCLVRRAHIITNPREIAAHVWKKKAKKNGWEKWIKNFGIRVARAGEEGEKNSWEKNRTNKQTNKPCKRGERKKKLCAPATWTPCICVRGLATNGGM